MKKIIPVLFFLFFLGCKEENRIEVIPNYDEIYVPVSKIDVPPGLIEDNQLKLIEKLNELEKSGSNKISVHYKLLIDESGNVEKIQILSGHDKKIHDLIIDEIKRWKFKPGMIDNKPVKSQYNFKFSDTDSIPESFTSGEYLVSVEEMPKPIGGIKAIQEKIVYPQTAKRAGVEGKVYVLAYIDEEGNVAYANIIRGIGAGLDEAAINAIKQTKFFPGKQNGKPVKVQVSIPILFKLE